MPPVASLLQDLGESSHRDEDTCNTTLLVNIAVSGSKA